MTSVSPPDLQTIKMNTKLKAFASHGTGKTYQTRTLKTKPVVVLNFFILNVFLFADDRRSRPASIRSTQPFLLLGATSV
jgi:hypothetical protein